MALLSLTFLFKSVTVKLTVLLSACVFEGVSLCAIIYRFDIFPTIHSHRENQPLSRGSPCEHLKLLIAWNSWKDKNNPGIDDLI